MRQSVLGARDTRESSSHRAGKAPELEHELVVVLIATLQIGFPYSESLPYPPISRIIKNTHQSPLSQSIVDESQKHPASVGA